MNRLRTRISRVLRALLRRVYGFDRWHISPLRERPYAERIIAYRNSRDVGSREAMVEIGCGLGDIVGNADFRQRLGLDAAVNVVRAARFVARLRRRRGIVFREFTFPGSLQNRHDTIVMVNWIHNIEPSVLKEYVRQYALDNLTPSGVIVLDTVGDARYYRFNHSIEDLVGDLPMHVERLGDFARDRSVWAVSGVVARESRGDGEARGEPPA